MTAPNLQLSGHLSLEFLISSETQVQVSIWFIEPTSIVLPSLWCGQRQSRVVVGQVMLPVSVVCILEIIRKLLKGLSDVYELISHVHIMCLVRIISEDQRGSPNEVP